MLKVGLIGIGFMGRGHLDNYVRLESEGFPIKLTAICDIDPKKFEGKFISGNIDLGASKYDFTKYNIYTDIDEMLDKEEFDYVDVVLPTYLHPEVAIKVLNKGINVFCEKPMALNSTLCANMVEAAKVNNRKLMIGQCLRFWPEYDILKDYVESKKFGKVLAGYFYRGGVTPKWSYQDWYLKKEKSGGAIFDQHVHDVDMINWLFGIPESVSTIGNHVLPEGGYDILSTNYFYNDGKVINAQDDWTLNGDYGFEMYFRVNFEKGNLIYKDGVLKINPNEGKGFIPEHAKEMGYYNEIKYFAQCIIDNKPILTANPNSTMQSIKIAEAEVLSADNNGKITLTSR